MKELQKIYDSEINFSISTLWDGGFDLKLGDKVNGFKVESSVGLAEEILPWLQSQIKIHFPDSKYIRDLLIEKK